MVVIIKMTAISSTIPEPIRIRASSLGVPGTFVVILVNKSIDSLAPPNLKKRVWSRMMETTALRTHGVNFSSVVIVVYLGLCDNGSGDKGVYSVVSCYLPSGLNYFSLRV